MAGRGPDLGGKKGRTASVERVDASACGVGGGEAQSLVRGCGCFKPSGRKRKVVNMGEPKLIGR